MCKGPRPYHDASEQAHALPAVSVGHHVAVADGEEGDGDEPHGPQEVAGHFLLVVIPGGWGEPGRAQSIHTGPSAFITPPGRQGPGSTWLHGGLDCRELITLEAQSVQGTTIGQGGGMVSARGSPVVLLRVPQGRGQPLLPSIPSNLLSPDPQAAGYWAESGPHVGDAHERAHMRGHARVHACAHNPPPKDRHTDRGEHGWPRAPEAAGSRGEDSVQTLGRTSPASKVPRREEDPTGRQDHTLGLGSIRKVDLWRAVAPTLGLGLSWQSGGKGQLAWHWGEAWDSTFVIQRDRPQGFARTWFCPNPRLCGLGPWPHRL